MSHATRRPRKTLEDYLALPDDVRAELIDGELYVTPSPSSRHQSVVYLVCQALHQWAHDEDRGRAWVAPLDVHLPSGDVVQPDVLFVVRSRLHLVREHIHGVPDLVVEVLSPDRPERDRFVKRALYARNGVPEYWIVDPEERTVEVLRQEAGTYAPAGFFRGNEVLASATLEGLTLPLLSLFER